MDRLKGLQRLTLNLIVVLVWFEILCFVIIFLGNIFKWSFLSETFSVGFFSAFGVGLGALIALAILHVALTMNIISSSLSGIARSRGIAEEEPEGRQKRSLRLGVGMAVGAIALVVLFFWVGEIQVNKYKIKVAMNSVESISRSPVAGKTADLIRKNAPVKELLDARDAMTNMLEERHGVSLIVPVKKVNETLYYELTPWWWSKDVEEMQKPLSEANLRLFAPYQDEKKKFDKMLADGVPYYSLERSSLRVFYPVAEDGRIVFIILLDTGRQASDAYLLKRSQSH